MAISAELSCDIAAALIAASDKAPNKLCELKTILVEVHAVLQELAEQTKIARLSGSLHRGSEK